jgi:hypothetical protein|nr:MAG TPA: ERF superfamily protein [Caudoviricetes sp.]
MFKELETNVWLELNAKLQAKKNSLRKKLSEKGILKKEGENKFDKYKYFSEAQYKMLFTQLFSECGLELKFNEVDYLTFEGTEKQANGRMAKIEFCLIDVDTGFYETTVITGEGIDKGDKAGYKAYTGALKYYLANTFMVATGDDVEKESPNNKMNTVVEKKATPKQIKVLAQAYTGDNLKKLLEVNKIERLEDIPMTKASELISKITGGNENEK